MFLPFWHEIEPVAVFALVKLSFNGNSLQRILFPVFLHQLQIFDVLISRFDRLPQRLAAKADSQVLAKFSVVMCPVYPVKQEELRGNISTASCIA